MDRKSPLKAGGFFCIIAAVQSLLTVCRSSGALCTEPDPSPPEGGEKLYTREEGTIVSASKENKTTPVTSETGMSREEKRRHDEAVSRRNTVVYTVIGVVVAVLVAALLIWDSGYFQRKTAAVTIDGEKYAAADVLYYYTSQYQNAYQYATYGMSTFNASKDPKDQVYDEASGQTWHEYFVEKAIDSLKTYVTVEKKAKEEGYTLSQEGKDSISSYKESMKSAQATSNYTSMKTYIQAIFGSNMTEKDFDRCLEREVYVNEYLNKVQDGYTYTDQQLEDYYKEHADELDSFTFDQLTFRASVSTTDADGKTIEMTDEEKAAKLEEAKKEMAALAQEAKARLDAGESMEDLAEAYGDKVYSSQLDTTRTGSSLNSTLSDWFLSADRKAGDTTLQEYDGSSTYSYYVVKFIDRTRDETPTADVRHILFSGEDEESKAKAKTDAEAMLETWKSGEATEDSFAQLAKENSADTGSASSGGLIEGITPTSSYVENFRDWATDSSRQPGDTGIVESDYGYHVMYFSAWGQPQWKLTAENALRSDDMNQWMDALLENVTVEQQSGISNVSKF